MAQDNILIIGAGTWGCSIALELARRGHTGITVLDGNDIPPSTSAGNHRNIIVEEAIPPSTPSPQDTLRTLSHQKWRTDPLLSPFYHATPLVTATTNSPPLPPQAAWINTRGATTAMRAEATKLGARFLRGPAHAVTQLLYATASPTLRGATTARGTTHLASTTILAAGAYSTLLLDFRGQVVPRAFAVAHIALPGPAPAALHVSRAGALVVDEGGREVQVVDRQAYVHPVANTAAYAYESVPFARAQIPLEAEARLRALLAAALPRLADCAFSHARMRWEAQGGLLVDRHPRLGNLVVAVGGDGGVGPGVGVAVADVVGGGDGGEGMRWREGCEGRDVWEGGAVDIGGVRGWTRVGE